jgi:hypothetical protein
MLRFNERVISDLEGPKVSLAVVLGLIVCALNVASVVIMLLAAD